MGFSSAAQPTVAGIPTEDAATHHPHPRGEGGSPNPPRFGALSLEYAVKCLRNCLFLLAQPAREAAAFQKIQSVSRAEVVR